MIPPLFQFTVIFRGDRLAPFRACILARDLYRKVRKPFVRRRAVPVSDVCRYVDHAARRQFDRFFAPFLIIASAAYADQDLPSSAFCAVDMPVVAAAGFERDVENRDLIGRYGREIALPDEILPVRIRLAYGEKYRILIFFFFRCGALGQPTYIVAWVMTEAISSLVTLCAFAFCR